MNLIFKVAEVIMTIPHSNAGEERIFSLINKTPSSSLKLDGTLSSLIVVKTHMHEELVCDAKLDIPLFKKNHQQLSKKNVFHI